MSGKATDKSVSLGATDRTQGDATATFRAIRHYLAVGAALAVALVFGFGGWAAMASLSSAVLGSGQVAVESNIKRVQHAEGGIVAEIAVGNGDRVEAGQLLMQLDGTAIKADRGIIAGRIAELSARRSRLLVERNGGDEAALNKALADISATRDRHEIVEGERNLYRARRQTTDGQSDQLQQRIGQIGEEIQGLRAQLAAKSSELELADKELDILSGLEKKKLVTTRQQMAAEREVARLKGEKGELAAAIARAKSRISETRMQIFQLREEFHEEVLEDLGKTETALSELLERKVAADDQLRRLQIKAPQSGAVHRLEVHTVGAVIAPGQEIMQIVPHDEQLIVEAKVAATDIDQIAVGQDAKIRFTAFNQRTTPEVDGTLYSIAPNVSEDERTGAQYFLVRLRPTETVSNQLTETALTPGMPAEILVRTGSRTALSYLTKPFADQLVRAFREE
ncbi:hypothetical protein B7H23_12290 [Notoacmeibacter marinus]|uniref:Membrane fusion protein (MFP) family protein n=1 Tax=Notoacmeibacter marinus TaxID=1876515 RepID=A0A231UZU6_9HYPH|nr:HlyD family type I secretion periplasmic adaptor subunit [Notoacmeibacter marinus]OXT00846.1 hypothetical protein B7H23_12290 [Notoacmeibacter marinus]